MADELDDEVRALYAGDPADFVKGRDALAKRLRADGQADDAAAVKALRKPSKGAGALDRAVAEDAGAAAALRDAAALAVDAQERGGDLRAATTGLRDAVRTLARRTGDPTAATAALVAVVADPAALEALLAGRLVDVPDAGGFGPLPLHEAKPPAKPNRAAERKRNAAKAAVDKAEAARDDAAAAHRAAAERLAAAEAALEKARAAID